MTYKIICTDRRYSIVTCYGEFTDLKEATAWMNTVSRNQPYYMKFKLEEIL